MVTYHQVKIRDQRQEIIGSLDRGCHISQITIWVEMTKSALSIQS